MPIRAVDLVANLRRIKVKTVLGECEVAYRTHQMTPAREQMMQELVAKAEKDGNQDRRVYLRIYQDLIAEWELTGPLYSTTEYDDNGQRVLLVEEGQMVPPTPDMLMHVSTQFLDDVLTAVQKDMNPDPKPSSETSEGGSFQKAS